MKKFHINSLELLSLLPEVKAADEKLQAETKTLEDQYAAMMKEYEAKAKEIQSQIETMDDLIKETKIKELQDTEQRIAKFQADAQEKVAKKQEELYKPIYEKADAAIKKVADENGYTYIFDTSKGGIIYAGTDAVDILSLVKTHLGLPDKAPAPVPAPATNE